MGRGLVALVLAGIVIPPLGDPPPPAGKAVVVATTGNRSELRETIPVTGKRNAKPFVAMSLSPRKMPALAEGDRLRVTAELQVTNNCYRRTPFCFAPRPYLYSPRIGTKLILARGENTVGGPDAIAISRRRERDCDQDIGNRQHHCMYVFQGSRLTIGDADELPCRLERCRVNLVVDAHHPKARRGDLVALGADRPGGHISDDRARLNVTRLRGGPIDVTRHRERWLRRHRVPVNEGPKYSVLSVPLPSLQVGEQLTFRAGLKVDIRKLHYSAQTGTHLILAERPGATRTTGLTRRVGSLKGEVTEANGFNCTQRTTPCRVRRVGTLVIEEDPVRDGQPVPLYVNMMLRNAPKEVPDRVRDFMRLIHGGIDVRRYP